jgi:type I site-specific restriction-modification system R (restriction) subunit
MVKKNEKLFIFDEIRQKWMVLLPEEWVRQNLLKELILNKKYPSSQIGIERKLPNSNKRFDIIVYKNSVPTLLIECKAPDIKISQKTLNQITGYLEIMDLKNVFITNGLEHFYIQRDAILHQYKISKEIPFYDQLI